MLDENKVIEYCKRRNEYGRPYYEDDILFRKVRIFILPIEYRTDIAYMLACRSIRGADPMVVDTEIKLLETQLLNDILEWYRRGEKGKVEGLKRVHFNYFHNLSHFYKPEGV